MTRTLSLLLALLIAPLLVSVAPPTASAQTDAGARRPEIQRRESPAIDTWSEPNPGLRFLHRTQTDPPLALHALVVDLTHEGVSVATTSEAERWDAVSTYAERRGAAAAINGGFWGLMQSPRGITAGGGEAWSASEPDADFGHFGVLPGGRAVVRAPGEGEDARSLVRLEGAVSGRPMLVVDGEVTTERLESFPTANLKQPRTAIGVSRDGRTVILVVVDGRQGHSRGMTLYQLARLLAELGAYRAINLDGGGSSAMYVARVGGLVSAPAAGRWTRALGLAPDETVRVRTRRGEQEVYVRGREREVMNHVAVFAPAPATEVAVQGSPSALADGLGGLERPRAATFAPATREPFRLGPIRELLYPALYVSAPLLALFALLRIARWVYRRRRRAAA